MQLGMIGLGRMGANLTRRLMRDGHQMVVWNRDPAPTATLAAEGAVGAESPADLVAKLERPRAVWIMVPAAVTGKVVSDVAELLDEGDTIIDGGNSYYRDDVARAGRARPQGHPLRRRRHVRRRVRARARLLPDDRRRGRGRGAARPDLRHHRSRRRAPPSARRAGTGEPATSEQGYLHCGGNGAGHFVKMVHNGIEYGIMAAYAEGLDILRNADVGLRDRVGDAETAPLDHPEFYRYTIDTADVAEVWRRGSVVGSWLLDLTAAALHESADLEDFSGRVSDSGEGRWTSIAAIEEGIPAYVLTAAVYERFSSRGEGTYANRVLSAMRKQFGGHVETARWRLSERGKLHVRPHRDRACTGEQRGVPWPSHPHRTSPRSNRSSATTQSRSSSTPAAPSRASACTSPARTSSIASSPSPTGRRRCCGRCRRSTPTAGWPAPGTSRSCPVDQGIEHSAGASFAKNPDYFDPARIVELAIEGGCNAVATTLGALGATARRYAHRIPFLLKLNHNEFLSYPNAYDQIMFALGAPGPRAGLRRRRRDDLLRLPRVEAPDPGGVGGVRGRARAGHGDRALVLPAQLRVLARRTAAPTTTWPPT